MTSDQTDTPINAEPKRRLGPESPWPDLLAEELLPVSAPVFHYTDSGALASIARHQRLWASQATSLNDRAEVIQGWKRVRKLLRGMSRSDAGAKIMLSFTRVSYRPASEVFILSASTRGDDANQWRLYGDGGSGYALELDSSARFAVAAQEGKGIVRTRFGILAADGVTISPWLPVIYKQRQLKAVLQEMASNVAAEDQRIRRDATSAEDQEHQADVLGEQIDKALAAVAHLVKSPGFSGENEARIVATLDFGVEHVHFRGSNNGVVGYLELASKPSGTPGGRVVTYEEAAGSLLPIRSVRGGPLITSRNHGRTIGAMFRQSDIEKMAYRKSKLSLR